MGISMRNRRARLLAAGEFDKFRRLPVGTKFILRKEDVDRLANSRGMMYCSEESRRYMEGLRSRVGTLAEITRIWDLGYSCNITFTDGKIYQFDSSHIGETIPEEMNRTGKICLYYVDPMTGSDPHTVQGAYKEEFTYTIAYFKRSPHNWGSKRTDFWFKYNGYV